MHGVFLALGILLAVTPHVDAAAQSAPAATPPTPAATARGSIVGTVMDRETTRPLASANVLVIGTPFATQTDLDGKFRFPAVPVGQYSVKVMRLGNAPVQIDSVIVRAGASTSVSFALNTIALTLQAVQVEAGPVRATSEDALLALQKSAPRVSDGISAEAIRRAPGADASDAIVRVTGVSVVNGKFAVVRGLAERYSNTLLNGVELPSPEPLKKIVPLDIFPSSLLESIVVSKTATPDRPGDFAGGSVEVSTKEFPDDRVAELSLNTSYSSLATFRNVALLPQRGADYFGFDAGNRRRMPDNPPTSSADDERFAEALRNVWTPAPAQVLPDLGGSANFGGRFGTDGRFGYATSATYRRHTEYTPNRLSQIIFDGALGSAEKGYVADESAVIVDLGAIVNLAARAGKSSKFGWRNLYTRNSDESLATTTGFETYNGPTERRTYQVRYVTRELAQTQLTGDHLLGWLFDTRIEWKGTAAVSARDEPENRSLLYFKQLSDGRFVQAPGNPSPYWFRFLDDRVRSGQVDVALPVRRILRDGSLLKGGVLYRERQREFDGMFFRLAVRGDMTGTEVPGLPPEQAIAPENLGTVFSFIRDGEGSLPYESQDDITAVYAMGDLPLTSTLRLVGGVRVERWRLSLYPGSREAPSGPMNRRRERDDLYSGNLTWSITERQNIRLAGYTTVARPDPREISNDYFIAVTGDCANRGNPNVRRTRILNGDARWEFYPAPGELLSVSAFYKHFDDPIVELLSFEGSGSCVTEYVNVDEAQLLGAELEVRRNLGFVSPSLERLAIGLNVTIVDSRATVRPTPEIVQSVRLQGQSNYLVNLSLQYADPVRGLEGMVLVNSFGDRIVRYGIGVIAGGVLHQVPHVMEQGRVTVDAKLQARVGPRITASISGRNLTDAEVKFYQGSDVGPVRTGYQRTGVSISLGMGYAIR